MRGRGRRTASSPGSALEKRVLQSTGGEIHIQAQKKDNLMATKTTKSARSGSTRKSTPRRIPSAATPNKKNTRKAPKARPQTRSGSAKTTTDQRRVSGRSVTPAASVAATQKALRAVERRENTLRKAVKRHKKSLKQLKKTLSGHRGTVKSLKTDLAEVSKTRKSISSRL